MQKRIARAAVLIVISSLLLGGHLAAGDSGNDEAVLESPYVLRSGVVGSAGAQVSGASFGTRGTMGQPTSIGTASGGGLTLYAGFWAKPWAAASILEVPDPEPFTYALSQNSPNPFMGQTGVRYSVARETHVEITVFSVRGQRVRTLVDETVPAGWNAARWDGRDGQGRDASPGVYFYRMSAGAYRSVRKMVKLR